MSGLTRAAQATPRATWFFVYLVTGCGAAILASVLMHLQAGLPPATWVLLLILTACSESFGIKLPSLRARITVSESFVFTSIFLFGTGPTVLLTAVNALVVALWQRRRQKLHHLLFNTFEPIISVWLASEVFFRVSGLPPLSQAPADMGMFVGPALLVPVLYFLTNSSLTAVAMALGTSGSPVAIWRDHFVWLSLNSFVSASIAGLLVQNPRVFLSSFAMSLPLLAVSHLVFRSSIGRVEDAQRHVDDLRRLYLSTIEALAIAVDAKDQVTHGHIRRVQQFALALARALDVKDERTLRAIEAAGLLHDIGKLAIPDHILNKPGKLTAPEFERMKTHAEAGAEILSAIEFPFPVVPIVRHHHENWDGSGYPCGLSADEIPLGARILSIVDCFDALTSDRPYRRALSVEEALAVLMERRGSMYDPAVVDRFFDICADVIRAHPVSAPAQVLVEISRSSHAGADATEPAQESSGRQVSGESRWNGQTDVADRVASALRTLLPVSRVVVYVYTPVRDELVPVYDNGEREPLAGERLPLGRTVSGWAAANRTSVVNGDPSLDVGIVGPASLLRSCLAIPLTAGDKLFGVLTLYSEHEQAFDATAQRVAESMTAYLLSMWIDGAKGNAALTLPATAVLPEIAQAGQTASATAAPRRPH